MKEDLPRIAYANPSLKIVVDKLDKKIEDTLIPEMKVEFRKSRLTRPCCVSEVDSSHYTILLVLPDDGTQYKIDMDKKWSSTIFTELLELHTKRGAKVKLKPSNVTGGKKEQTAPTERKGRP